METLEVFEEDLDFLPVPDEYADVDEQVAFQAAIDAKFFLCSSAPKFEASFVAQALTSAKVSSPAGSDVSTGPGSLGGSVPVYASSFSSSAPEHVSSFSRQPLISAERAAEPPANLRDRRGRPGLAVETRTPKARASRWNKTPESSSAHHAESDDESGTPDAPGTFHIMAPRKSSSRLIVLENSDSSKCLVPTPVAEQEGAAAAEAKRLRPRQSQNRCCLPLVSGKRGQKKS